MAVRRGRHEMQMKLRLTLTLALALTVLLPASVCLARCLSHCFPLSLSLSLLARLHMGRCSILHGEASTASSIGGQRMQHATIAKRAAHLPLCLPARLPAPLHNCHSMLLPLPIPACSAHTHTHMCQASLSTRHLPAVCQSRRSSIFAMILSRRRSHVACQVVSAAPAAAAAAPLGRNYFI